MGFVELSRCFSPVRKDQELDPALGRNWGKRLRGWLDWNGLYQHRRVVLLAEALSGKSEEFRNQARLLAAKGKPAFFLPIEALADQGFEAALGSGEAASFEAWKSGTGEGWFFLDSIDEARLNRKNFETALKRFARDCGIALERASIFVSCRVTDWKEREDRRAIAEWLPASRKAAAAIEEDDQTNLLAPIFDEHSTTTRSDHVPPASPHELLVVQIVPLDAEQAETIAVWNSSSCVLTGAHGCCSIKLCLANLPKRSLRDNGAA